jgi:peptidoglycan-associated lipoprotein
MSTAHKEYKTMKKLTMGKSLAALSAVLLLAACQSDEEMPAPMMTAAPAPAPAPAPMAAARPPQAPPMAAPAPAGVVPGTIQDFQQNVGDRVLFGYDRSDLEDSGRSTLQKQAAWLQRFPTVVLTIEGHADERGTREYNLALGARRAQAVRDYLVSLGVTGARIETISYGKERPICVQSDEACWTQNRRGVSTIKSGAVS